MRIASLLVLCTLVACDAPVRSEESVSQGSAGEETVATEPAPNEAAVASAETEPPEDLPTNPSRDDVRQALGAVGAVISSECQTGTRGVATAAIVFDSSGHVKRVDVTGLSPAGNACVAQRVRQATLPPFSRPEFNVSFPFRVR